jgi:hypothetical protein
VTTEENIKMFDQSVAEGKVPDLTKVICVTVYDWLPWFRPDSIEVGWVASKENHDSTGFRLYYDSRRSRAYFWWHYS